MNLIDDPVGLTLMRYAYVCAEIAVNAGQMTEKEYDEMGAAILQGKSISKSNLERLFPEAIRRMQEVAAKEGITDYWTFETLHYYFLKYHTIYIDEGDGQLSKMNKLEKEICKCKIGLVVEKTGEKLTIENVKGEEDIIGRYLPEANIGDIVVSHRRFATEILDLETAELFGYQQK